MEQKNKLLKRKHPRLKQYDYGCAGAYFITVCTQNRRCILSRIVKNENTDQSITPDRVGRRKIPPRGGGNVANATKGDGPRGGAPAEINQTEYTLWGKIAQKQLLLLQERYPCLTVDRYVIMPNHIHVILILKQEAAGASPRPTIMDIVCAYKSLTMRECKQNGFNGKLFQSSFYDHVIRDEADYLEKWNYIDTNPARWEKDPYHC